MKMAQYHKSHREYWDEAGCTKRIRYSVPITHWPLMLPCHTQSSISTNAAAILRGREPSRCDVSVSNIHVVYYTVGVKRWMTSTDMPCRRVTTHSNDYSRPAMQATLMCYLHSALTGSLLRFLLVCSGCPTVSVCPLKHSWSQSRHKQYGIKTFYWVTPTLNCWHTANICSYFKRRRNNTNFYFIFSQLTKLLAPDSRRKESFRQASVHREIMTPLSGFCRLKFPWHLVWSESSGAVRLRAVRTGLNSKAQNRPKQEANLGQDWGRPLASWGQISKNKPPQGAHLYTLS